MSEERIYKVRDCIGRTWHVTSSQAREDFKQAIMQMDQLTDQQAEQYVLDDEKHPSSSWQNYWFYEQIATSPALLMKIGYLAEDISDERKAAILNNVAKAGSMEVIH